VKPRRPNEWALNTVVSMFGGGESGGLGVYLALQENQGGGGAGIETCFLCTELFFSGKRYARKQRRLVFAIRREGPFNPKIHASPDVKKNLFLTEDLYKRSERPDQRRTVWASCGGIFTPERRLPQEHGGLLYKLSCVFSNPTVVRARGRRGKSALFAMICAAAFSIGQSPF